MDPGPELQRATGTLSDRLGLVVVLKGATGQYIQQTHPLVGVCV